MARSPLNIKTLRAAALATLAFLACILAAAQTGKGTIAIKGAPGELTFTSTATIAARSEVAGDAVRWYLACPGGVQVPKGLEGVVKPASGGLVIELPMSSNPEVTWRGDAVLVRWGLGSSKGTARSGDAFGLDKTPSYPLGPGDKLQITVYNVEDMNQTVTVDPGGFITFPVLDKVMVQGLSVNELQKKLEDQLAQFVKNPQVNIQLLEYGSRFVNVMGQVRQPGRIPLKGTLKILDAISQAGGFTDNAGDVEVQRRDTSGQLQSKVFSKEDLLTGNSEKVNIYVLDQDVINVQVIKSVYVNGEVTRPGPFPYSKEMTLLRAITYAGGFTQWANKGRVDILREDKAGTKVIHVDAGDVEKGKVPDVPLLPNDQVVVRERKFF